MIWSVIRVIFKASSVTPNFFYVFNLVASFSTCSQSFYKICVWEVLGANVLKSNRDSVRKVRKTYLIERGQTLEPRGLNKKDET